MYIETVPNRNSPPAILLREGRRQGGRVIKRTLANLSGWPAQKIEALRAALRGQAVSDPAAALRIERSLPHGHVHAILDALGRLGLARLIDPRPSRQRDLVVAMIAQRLLDPCSKLASARLLDQSTLGEELGVAGADVDELYGALGWLLARQARIQRRLAARHLRQGAPVLYDLSSSYYEGRTCPLARFGHDRDGRTGCPIIVYGVLASREGCPVAIEVYPGNTGDPSTLEDQTGRLRGEFGLRRVVIVGDRGTITPARIDALRQQPGLGWITALRSAQIAPLIARGVIQPSLFDRCNLAEIYAPEEFPGERLVVCFNPLLAEQRRDKRQALLRATEELLDKLRRQVRRRTRTPLGAEAIGLKAGRALHRFKMAKHFTLRIEPGLFEWVRNAESIEREAALDGIYVIRTSERAEDFPAPDAVRTYKSLARVESAFRTLKGVDLLIRPIFHRLETSVRAHFFLCLLAYYVEWHLRRAWAPLLFDDEELEELRARRDPVAPAKPSPSARRKKSERRTAEGLEIQSFPTLLAHLGTQCRNRCRFGATPDAPGFDRLTEPTPLQEKAFALLERICSQ
jgi:hypothetical protein